MIRKSHKNIEWLEFELLAEFPNLQHGVFLRHGGTSQGKYASLNLSFGVGDDSEAVKRNHHKINEILQIPKICWSNQVHGNHISIVDYAWDNCQTSCDGLATNHLNRGLMINHADCQAAIIYDPRHHALANVHCGWRGSVKNIYAEAIRKMQHTFGSKPEDLYVGVSPSLGPQNSEFINYKTELPDSFWEFQIKPTYFDFWGIAQKQFLDCGLLMHHIQIAGICTYQHFQDCYSYRRDKIRGGHGTIAVLT
jgi:polyphenol oxidase